MTNRDEVREFLTSRRANVSPDDVDLPSGGSRRVPGLRRGEVAMLAGVSVEYYARVERGNLTGVSEGVLAAIAGALRLDDAERAHLFDLARAANTSPVRAARKGSRPRALRPGLQRALDAITDGPAFVRNGRMDILAENALFRALYADLYAQPQRPVNLARWTFLSRDQAEAFYPDWDAAARINVGILRTEAGRNPYDEDLQDLVGELSTRSDEFRTLWAAHDVREHAHGTKHFHHPVVGELRFTYEAMQLMADRGLNFLIYTAEPGSRTEESLRLLASWAASADALVSPSEARIPNDPEHVNDVQNETEN
jgi:transcriptional regulator with XRE-family HTH domain